MLATYGYADASGEFFITIDTDKCDGCRKCVEACPAGVFETALDENDPLSDQIVAKIAESERRRIKYTCGPCKPTSGARNLPCEQVCVYRAIVHSW
jgi:Fe-S-cluster-containing hydrogenase component 2